MKSNIKLKSTFKFIPFLLVFCIAIQSSQAQYATKKVKSKYEEYTDSIKQVKYDYIFPILGQGVYKKGFDIPYPVGIMANAVWMRQDILIDNLQLGLTTDDNDIPLTDVDFIEFGTNVNNSYSVNFRPDIWILPFLNVYGLFGYGHTRTEVNLVAPIELKSVVEQNINTKGFGLLSGFGLGPVWVSLDANWTWNKPELLDQAVMVNIFGARFGQTFKFENNPERNFAVWVGAMRASMSSTTIGQITLSEALPPDVWERTDELVDNYWDWYNSLNPNNPVDKVKMEAADEVLTPIVDRIDEADGSSIIKYGMDKQVAEKWNGIIGGQFQYSKRWMFRTELGVIGNRKSVLGSINYRFLL